jgi:excisionase family DNA binding protein
MKNLVSPETPPRSSTIADVARRHRVARATIRRQVRDGFLGAVKIGRCIRIPLDAEVRWLAAGQSGVTQQNS